MKFENVKLCSTVSNSCPGTADLILESRLLRHHAALSAKPCWAVKQSHLSCPASVGI